MSSMKRNIWILAAAAALALAGCSGGDKPADSSGTASSGSGEKIQIAMIPKGTTHEFWKSVHAGADQAASEMNVDLIWKGPLKEDDRDEQIKVVEDFTTKQVKAILLAPLDDSALRASVLAAQAAGIPVAIFDSGLKDVETVSFVATDNHAAGMIGGSELGKLLGTDGPKKVIVLRYQLGSASTMEREDGALMALKAQPNIEIISDNQFAGATSATAQEMSEKLITQFKNADGTPKFDGVFCPNESSAFGMLLALKSNGLAGKVKFVGFDSSTKLVEGLSAGEIDGLVVQNPFKMGYETVKTMVAHLKGEKVEKRIDTGATFVSKANMNDPEVAKLIAPPK
ncbi:MAG: substrate-binding domain-containing protein [Fimbriimonadaceae bacterium]|nr:substrate-binding domain-containing protein [Fimbriimonadaceae bacterium]